MRRPLGTAMLLQSLVCLACGDDPQASTLPASVPTSTAPPTMAAESPQTEPPPTGPAGDRPTVAPSTAPVPGEIEIVPGVSAGAIRIGMTEAEVLALGLLRPHPQYSAMTIPMTVYYEEGVVARVEVSLLHAPAAVVGEMRFTNAMGMAGAAAALTDCEELEVGYGGNSQFCRDRRILLNVGSGNPDEFWIRTQAPGTR